MSNASKPLLLSLRVFLVIVTSVVGLAIAYLAPGFLYSVGVQVEAPWNLLLTLVAFVPFGLLIYWLWFLPKRR